MFSGMVCRFKNSCFQFTYLLYIDIYFPKKKNYKPSLSKQLLIYNRSLGVSRLASEVRPRQRAQSFTKTTRIKKNTHCCGQSARSKTRTAWVYPQRGSFFCKLLYILARSAKT